MTQNATAIKEDIITNKALGTSPTTSKKACDPEHLFIYSIDNSICKLIVLSFNCFNNLFSKVSTEKTLMASRAFTKNTSSVGDNETALIIESSTATTKTEIGIKTINFCQLLSTS